MNFIISELFNGINYTRRFQKGDIIYYQGDSPSSFYYLKSGRVRVYMTSPDGVEHTLSSAESGDILGEAAFFDKMPRVSSAEALGEAVVAVINEEALLSLTRENPRLALELLRMQALRVRELSAQLDAMTFLNADERIARLLLANMNSAGEVNLTHEQIAEATGVTRVTVSKIMRSFREKGIIKTEYRKIVITNSEKLKK